MWVLLVGGLVAIPLSYVWVNDWLENFHYKDGVSFVSYGLAVVLVGLLVLGTVGLQVWRSTRMDPVESLREE